MLLVDRVLMHMGSFQHYNLWVANSSHTLRSMGRLLIYKTLDLMNLGSEIDKDVFKM